MLFSAFFDSSSGERDAPPQGFDPRSSRHDGYVSLPRRCAPRPISGFCFGGYTERDATFPVPGPSSCRHGGRFTRPGDSSLCPAFSPSWGGHGKRITEPNA